MLFNSWTFAALLVPTLALYWATRVHALRLTVLLIASLLFYSFHHWPSVFLLLASIGVNYTFGRVLEARRSKAWLTTIITINLSTLLWFKYGRFVFDQINALATLPWPAPSPWLPLGISFFTFQVIAYQVDIYRGHIKAERSLLVFGVFKSFFAQLIAGPIVRADAFLPQLRQIAPFDGTRVLRGAYLFVFGLFLKSAIADVLAQFANQAFSAPLQQATNDAWLGLFAYALQLFCDFWGYSTMAVGLGLLFGLALPVNFELPYLASSLQAFWRRWHITLSAWFRDYLYIPLGGNRSGHAARNLVITMTLAGLWHGAGWNFVLWGAAHGTWLVVERHVGWRTRTAHADENGVAWTPLPALLPRGIREVLATAVVFIGVCLLWVLFRSPDLATAGAYYSRLLLPPYTWNIAVTEELPVWLVLALAASPLVYRLASDTGFASTTLRTKIAWSVFFVVACLAYGGSRFDFIYFNF